jgi:hypothetical protein
MKPIKVEFLNQPNVVPKIVYKRCLFTLWLLKCTYPNYRLDADMQVIITFSNGQKFFLIIKEGYECDLASIPRPLWSIYPPDGNYRYTAIVHDILYQSESFTRQINDNIFKIGMQEDVPNDVRNMFYKGVRVGGGFVYMGHTEETIAKAKEYFIIGEIK